MEFNMNKLLNENYKTIVNLLIYQLALSKSRLNGNRSTFDTLQELRTINIGCIRASGTTQAVAELFDVKNDVYITSNMAMLYEFNERLYGLGKIDKLSKSRIQFKYLTMSPRNNVYDENMKNEIIRKLNGIKREDLNVLPSVYKHDFKSMRGRPLYDDSNIWFDLGNSIANSRNKEILSVIDTLERVYSEGKLTYIIM